MLGDLIVCYLFLGGAGAGTCFVLAAMTLLVPADVLSDRASQSEAASGGLSVPVPYRRLFGSGYAVALAALLGGVACLLADVGNADRVVLLFTHPTWSFLTVGAWALAVCMLLATLLGSAWLGAGSWSLFALRGIAVVSGVIALVVATYTGLLLQSMAAVPLWATPLLPVLFVASSVSCGIACVLGSSHVSGAALPFATVARRLAAIDIAVIVLEAAVAGVFAGMALAVGDEPSTGTSVAALASAQELLIGEGSWLFWVGFVTVGLAIPVVLEVILTRMRRPLALVALSSAACVLVGGFALRLSIMEAGMHPLLACVIG